MAKHPAYPGQVLFVGHGSPMNALQDNDYTRDLKKWGAGHPKPAGIVVVSAHWLTQGTLVSCQPRPRQIYDFYGFPDELYAVSYPCPGDPELAKKTVALLNGHPGRGRHWSLVEGACSDRWGIDHAAWAVLKHLYPQADIPVVELSLDMSQPPEHHFRIGQALRPLREENVLILASGNIVHNLGLISWDEAAAPQAWALEMDAAVKELLEKKDTDALITYPYSGRHAVLGIPTQDHYLPLLYVLGLQGPQEKVRFVHESIQNATVSMRCLELANP